jgi:uncharacterized protein
MKTFSMPAPLQQLLKQEDAPAFGSGPMAARDERTFVILAQLFPLIVWPWKRRQSPAVDAQGKEAFNFGITLFIGMFAMGVVGALTGRVGTLLVAFVTPLISFAALLLVIMAVVAATKGKLLRYPINLRLIK